MTGTERPKCRRKCSLTKIRDGKRAEPKVGSGVAGGVERREGGRAVLLFFKLFDFEFGFFETGFAGFEQGVALFELGEELGQRNVARFHGFDDGFKAGEGVLEGR